MTGPRHPAGFLRLKLTASPFLACCLRHYISLILWEILFINSIDMAHCPQRCSIAVPWGRQSTSLAPSFKASFLRCLPEATWKAAVKLMLSLSWAERTCRCPSPCHYSPRIPPFWPISPLKISVAWGKPSVFSLILDSISLILGNAPSSHSLPFLYGFHGRYSLSRWSWRKMPIKFLVRFECLQKTFSFA